MALILELANVGHAARPLIMRQRLNELAAALPQAQGSGVNPLLGLGAPEAVIPSAPPRREGDDPDNIGQRLVSDLMRDLGLTKEQAAGVVGNLHHESGGFEHLQEISPIVEGSRGGFGYAQWTGPRRRAFEAWAAERGLDPTRYDANYGFLLHELTNTPESSVLGHLRGTRSADEAARVFSERFLRPGIPHLDRRVKNALLYL